MVAHGSDATNDSVSYCPPHTVPVAQWQAPLSHPLICESSHFAPLHLQRRLSLLRLRLLFDCSHLLELLINYSFLFLNDRKSEPNEKLVTRVSTECLRFCDINL